MLSRFDFLIRDRRFFSGRGGGGGGAGGGGGGGAGADYFQ